MIIDNLDAAMIKVHILETKRLLKLVKDHPLMSIGMKVRLKELKRRLKEIQTNAQN